MCRISPTTFNGVDLMRNRHRKKRGHAWLKISAGIFFLVIAGLIIAASAIFKFDEWQSLNVKLITECDRSAMVYDRNGELLCIASDTEKRIWVDIDTIPMDVIEAFVSAEDARYYTHEGVDIVRIFGAAWADLKAGEYVQGASTISQQLIKLSHLSPEKTLNRKLEEAVLAMTLEKFYDKNEIMEMYLNYVYFGGGYYGIEAASLGYFGVHASELSNAQAAQLAGILKSPSNYAPHLDIEASLGRRNVVLGLMKEYGCLSEAEYAEAIEEKCTLNCAFPTERSTAIDYALTEACDILGTDMETLLSSGAQIYTTIDGELDAVCVELLNDDSTFPSDTAQGALTVLDSTGGIVSMVGGRGEYIARSLNRAADIERQPGSLIKPIIVYAPAIERYGCTAATMLLDEKKSFGDYSPRNSDDKYYGWVTMRTAVTKSLNVPAVELLSDIGLPSAVMFAKDLGISFEGEDIGLSLALGGFTYGVSTLEMAGAYSAFSNGGVFYRPTSINRIESGDVVYSRSVSGERVMSSANAYILTSMLQSVASEGTGRRLAELGLPIAAKTGTSVDANGVRDAWCAVYSSEYTAVAWMGVDDPSKGSLPAEAVGGKCTADLLAKLFGRIYGSRTCPNFNMPEDVSVINIDTRKVESGEVMLASTLTPEEYLVSEYFAAGTAPTAVDGYWTIPRAPDEIGWSINAYGAPVITFCSLYDYLEYRLVRINPDGTEEIIQQTANVTGLVSHTDNTAICGAVYSYYVIAVHPELEVNGSEAASEPSRSLRVFVPFR